MLPKRKLSVILVVLLIGIIIVVTLWYEPKSSSSVVPSWTPSSSLNITDYVQVNPQFFVLPKRKFDDTSTLVLVTSSCHQADQRNEIRKTWADTDRIRKYHVEVNFVIGVDSSGGVPNEVTKESAEHQDILVVNVIDTYLNLTLKSVFMLQYLSNIDGITDSLKTVLKTDDDCYVNVKALARMAKHLSAKPTMVGALLGEKLEKLPVIRPSDHPKAGQDKWAVPYWMYKPDHFPKSLSGSGYAWQLSMSSCLYKASLEMPFIMLEDVYVTGFLAKKCHMSLKNSIRFKYMGIPEDRFCLVDPLKDVVIHRVDLAKMHQRMLYNKVFSSDQNGIIDCIF